MSSYQISERINAQVILWAFFGVIAALCRLMIASLRLSAFFCRKYAPSVGKALLMALPWFLALAAACGAVLVIVSHPVIVGCLALVAVFAVATYPRAVRS